MVVGTVVGGWLVGWVACGRCVGCGARELQLLATTHTSPMLASVDTWNLHKNNSN
jgi:hypothetical protein